MASRGGVTIIISGKDETGAVFEAVQQHMARTSEEAATFSETMVSSMRNFQETIMLLRDAFILDRAYDAMKEMLSSSVELAMEMGHLAEQTGISTQNLSVLRYTANQTGIDFDTLTKGFKKMSTDIWEWNHGEKLAGEAFQDLGFSLQDIQNKGQDMYGIMAMIADRFKDMPDGPQKLALAVELFGRAGQQLIPILNQGAAGLDAFKTEAEAMGVVLDENGVKKMEELHSSAERLKAMFEGLGLTISNALAPPLEALGNWISRNFDAGLYAIKEDALDAYEALLKMESAMHVPGTAQALGQLETYRKEQDRQEYVDWEKRQYPTWDPNKSPTDNLMSFLHAGKPPMEELGAAQGGAMAPQTEDYIGKWLRVYRTFGDEKYHPVLDAIKQLQDIQEQGAKDDEKVMAALYPLSDLQKQANEQLQSQVDQVFKSAPVAVKMAPDQADFTALHDAGEKMGHAIFDPLFQFGEKWETMRKQLVQGTLRTLGELAESQLFAFLFGDAQGRGGRGLGGGSWEGNANAPGRTGLAGSLIGEIFNGFHRKTAPVSNGGLGSGAGTIPSAAAALMQMGKGGTGGSGGVQVVINNQGAPVDVGSVQHTQDGLEKQVIQIMLKQGETNGPIMQMIAGVAGGF